MLVDSSIRHVAVMSGVIIQAERHLFQHIILVSGARHGWSVVTSAVCCSDWVFFLADSLVWGKHFAVFFICVRSTEAA